MPFPPCSLGPSQPSCPLLRYALHRTIRLYRHLLLLLPLLPPKSGSPTQPGPLIIDGIRTILSCFTEPGTPPRPTQVELVSLPQAPGHFHEHLAVCASQLSIWCQ